MPRNIVVERVFAGGAVHLVTEGAVGSHTAREIAPRGDHRSAQVLLRDLENLRGSSRDTPVNGEPTEAPFSEQFLHADSELTREEGLRALGVDSEFHLELAERKEKLVRAELEQIVGSSVSHPTAKAHLD